MRLGIDLDGIIVDFVPTFIAEFHKRCATVPESYTPKQWAWHTSFGISQPQYYRISAEIYSLPNFWANLPAYEDEVKVVREAIVNNPQSEFFFITARPRGVYSSTLVQTNLWLKQHGLLRSNSSVIMAHHSSSKKAIYESCNIDKAVDDNAGIVGVSSELCWLYLRPWNRDDFMRMYGVNAIANSEELKEKFLNV